MGRPNQPLMSITEVEIIINEVAFKEFSPRSKTVEAFGGKYLTRGGQIIALDGGPPQSARAQNPFAARNAKFISTRMALLQRLVRYNPLNSWDYPPLLGAVEEGLPSDSPKTRHQNWPSERCGASCGDLD